MDASERASLLHGSPALAPVPSLGAQVESGSINSAQAILQGCPRQAEGRQYEFTTCFKKNRRILMAAFMGMALFASLAIAAGIFLDVTRSKRPSPPPHPTPQPLPYKNNATILCNELPIAMANQYQWFQTSVLPPISSSITSIWNMFCAGTKIEDPNVMNQGQYVLGTLTNTFANMTTQMVTGIYYQGPQVYPVPNNLAEVPFSLVVGCTRDFANTEIGSGIWSGIEGVWAPSWSGAEGWSKALPIKITADIINRLFYVCIDMACQRKALLQPVFSVVNNTLTYTCTDVPKIDELIEGLAQWTNGWNYTKGLV